MGNPLVSVFLEYVFLKNAVSNVTAFYLDVACVTTQIV